MQREKEKEEHKRVKEEASRKKKEKMKEQIRELERRKAEKRKERQKSSSRKYKDTSSKKDKNSSRKQDSQYLTREEAMAIEQGHGNIRKKKKKAKHVEKSDSESDLESDNLSDTISRYKVFNRKPADFRKQFYDTSSGEELSSSEEESDSSSDDFPSPDSPKHHGKKYQRKREYDYDELYEKLVDLQRRYQRLELTNRRLIANQR